MKGKRCLYPRICLLLLAKQCEQKNQSLKMSENHAIYIGFYAYAGLYKQPEIGRWMSFFSDSSFLAKTYLHVSYCSSMTTAHYLQCMLCTQHTRDRQAFT